MQRNMKEEFKDITIDQLAGMMNKSFIHLSEKIDVVDKKLEDFRAETKAEFNGVHEQLDRIENVLIRDDRKRIERLEDKLLHVEVILGKKL